MVQKINDWVRKSIGFDGLLHIVLSAIMVGALKHIMGALGAVAVVALIGIGKEIYDRRTKGCAEFKDLVCDLTGIMVGVL
jgi:uncharacterized protein YfiM (DUF2279 family)